MRPVEKRVDGNSANNEILFFCKHAHAKLTKSPGGPGGPGI